jgi:putative FmdB family regulatory protein
MPIYEYRCANCNKVNEFSVGVGQEEAEIKCKYCGSEKMTRMISAPCSYIK